MVGPVIHEYYGATETGAFIVHGPEEALAKPGTVGRPLPGGTVRVYDTEGGTPPTGAVMALLAMPGVRDCAIFGIPDEEFGETLCTHVEPDPEVLVGAAEVAAFLASVWPISKCRG
jgi:acyl-coenzyme A synthetase/AMP-(fatty) acid ligase